MKSKYSQMLNSSGKKYFFSSTWEKIFESFFFEIELFFFFFELLHRVISLTDSLKKRKRKSRRRKKKKNIEENCHLINLYASLIVKSLITFSRHWSIFKSFTYSDYFFSQWIYTLTIEKKIEASDLLIFLTWTPYP